MKQCKKMVEADLTKTTIQYGQKMRFACRIPKGRIQTHLGCLTVIVVNCSKKCFEPQQQQQRNTLLPSFGNAVQLYDIDSHICTKEDGKRKYCCVVSVRVVTRTRHNIMSCINFLSCYTTQCKRNGRLHP